MGLLVSLHAACRMGLKYAIQQPNYGRLTNRCSTFLSVLFAGTGASHLETESPAPPVRWGLDCSTPCQFGKKKGG